MHKILIIEDDDAISNLMKSALTKEGYTCETAPDGLTGEQMFDSKSWDLVLLDLMLPGISGFELIDYIKPSKTPVIIISAMNQTGDKIRGLKMGADDYIGKPFQIGELLARVEALLRRTSTAENIFTYMDIEVNLDSRTVTRSGEPVTLTAKEFDLLETFIRNKNVAISRSNLYEMVWNEPIMGDTRTIDNHVSSLRKKLGYDGLIRTVHGIGYRMDVIR
ncbi:MAG: response regulator transcription factor [Clostridiales bacterium]|nr:response regulator transcription factor [Clostridiales bacterium]